MFSEISSPSHYIPPEIVYNFPLKDISRNAEFLKSLADPAIHAAVLWAGIEGLATVPLEQIPTILGIVELLNVRRPELLALPHSQQIVAQLYAILHDPDYKAYDDSGREFTQAVINHINNGGVLARYIDWIQTERAARNIATPLPSFSIIRDIYRHISGQDTFMYSRQELEAVISYAETTPFSELSRLTPIYMTFTTTGFGRARYDGNDYYQNIAPFMVQGATYIEVGASLGAFAVDTKRALGFRKLIATDLMSEEESHRVMTLYDYSGKTSIPVTQRIRDQLERAIDHRIWGHDILKTPLAKCIEKVPGQKVFGLHNILVHLTAKDKAIANTIVGVIEEGDILWISGGFCANKPLLLNMAFIRTGSGMAPIFIGDYASNRWISSKSDLEEVVRGERRLTTKVD